VSHGAEDATAGPARRELWRWVWTRVRPYVGWVLALLGGVALFLGWWGVSGEALTAKQIPYLVSGGMTGVALVVLAGVFLGTEDVRHQLDRVAELERKVDELHALFAAELGTPDTSADPGAAADGEVVALPAGTSYHRPGCALVNGKADAVAVSRSAITKRALRPCRVCDPDAQD
jgi:hypothetical protein